MPAVGLTVVVLVSRLPGHADTATTDAYIRSYHERGGTLRVRDLWAKLVESAATLGSGGALGYEGPALISGATLGSWSESRFMQRFRQDDAKVLMVAGAAAGIAAVFRAPLTGVVFALEVPYTQDVARRALLPALIAASTSYVTYVALLGTGRIFAISGGAPFDTPRPRRRLRGRTLVRRVGSRRRLGDRTGQAPGRSLRRCGPRARAWRSSRSRSLPNSGSTRPFPSGPATKRSTGRDGHETAFGLLVALFFIRFAATWFTVAGGGVGGLFIPLVTQGALVGYAVQAIAHAPNAGLFPTVGIAAFLGAGYRTPLAGVSFVAEATGQPGFVVPALLAAAASQLVMGRWSFSFYQRDERRPNVIPLDRLPIERIMSPNPDTVTADHPVDKCLIEMSRQNRRWVPVVDNDHYVGLLALTEIAKIPPEDWPGLRARDVARTDVPTARSADSVARIAELIRTHDAGAIAITDEGRIIGVVTIRDIGNVERLLDRLDPETNQ